MTRQNTTIGWLGRRNSLSLFLQRRWLNNSLRLAFFCFCHTGGFKWQKIKILKIKIIICGLILIWQTWNLKQSDSYFPHARENPSSSLSILYFCLCHQLCSHLATVNNHHRALVTSLRISACYSKYHLVIVSWIELGPKRKRNRTPSWMAQYCQIWPVKALYFQFKVPLTSHFMDFAGRWINHQQDHKPLRKTFTQLQKTLSANHWI